VSRIQNLEKYITDDVVRHGNRLNELEKKITNVYQEFTSTEAIDDDALFANEDDEEEESAFVMGQFTEDIGEDFLGLRELGIAAEFGLSSLNIPKRLLKGKKNAKDPNAAAKSAEPPLPYPPPALFVQLTKESVKSQVGLLRSYFEHRLASAGLDSLPDDPPYPAQAKLGPLGQVIRPSSAAMAAAAAGSKKKAKPKDAVATPATATPISGAMGATTAVFAGTTVAGAAMGGLTGAVVVQPMTPVLGSTTMLSPLGGTSSVIPPAMPMASAAMPTGEPQSQVQTPKKKKAALGGGAGTGGVGAGTGGGSGGSSNASKKRGRPPEGLPPVVVASA